MRIRSTKPEFWRSERVAEIDWDARLVLKGLESYVDDNGVGKDDLALIVSDVFPRDLARDLVREPSSKVPEPSSTLQRVKTALQVLSSHGFIHRYVDNGTNLLYLSWWDSTQYINRATKGRFRRPDGTLEYKESEIGEPSSNLPEPSSNLLEPSTRARVGTGDQGIRGTGNNSCASADAERVLDLEEPPSGDRYDTLQSKRRDKQAYDEFCTWYDAYPRKRGKGQAMKAYKRARKTASATVLLEAVKAQASHLIENGTEYCPYPATWLNGERWADETDHAPDRPKYGPGYRNFDAEAADA